MNTIVLGVFLAVVIIFFLIILISFIKYCMQGGKYRKRNQINGKVVIITGANAGIGKETALELARRGGIIYMACRDMKKCEMVRAEIELETGNTNLHCRKLDLASLKSVRSFVENFKKEQNRLDILINNAGIMNTPLMRTKEGFEMQIGVNHMGHFLLTNLLLDLLKKSSPSRIIVLSSIMHTRGKINIDDLNSEKSYNRFDAYNQSKLANILHVRELSRKLTGTGVTVNAVHPGVVDTELFNTFVRLLLWPFMKTVKNGAETTLYAALDPDLQSVSGLYFSDCKSKDVSNLAKDDAMAKWLWDESEKWTGLSS